MDQRNTAIQTDSSRRRQRMEFALLRVTQADLAGIHGPNERIAIETYRTLIEGYQTIIRAIDATNDSSPVPAGASS